LPPYSWTKTGGVTLSSDTGTRITVRATPGVNNFGTDAAFIDVYTDTFYDPTFGCSVGDGLSPPTPYTWGFYNCLGEFQGLFAPSVKGVSGEVWAYSGIDQCHGAFIRWDYNSHTWQGPGITLSSSIDDNHHLYPEYTLFDVRTAAVIAGGCSPCDATGATVTVTDAVGVSVTYVI